MNCILCGKDDSKYVESYEGKNGRIYSLYKCPSCSVVFSDPMRPLSDEEYQNISPEDYYIDRWEFGKAVGFLHGKKRIFEAGCGDGRFLYIAKQRGHDAIGVDINENALRIAKARLGDEKVYKCTLDQFAANFPREKFDAVCAFHIVEHLSDPLGFVRAAAKMMNKDGLLVLSVPSQSRQSLCYSTREEWDRPPHHLSWWDNRSLRKLMEAAGFEVIVRLYEPLTVKSTVNSLIKKVRFGIIAKIEKNRAGTAKDGGSGSEASHLTCILGQLKRAMVLPLVPFCLVYDRARGLTGRNVIILARKKSEK
ncbi:MAG: class I SAM-dependent methyltransferase [Candidatus Omnitrophica bacterium]|nr:class I SAM-dependent methyltransferase [Candidatus Omnitrophota bacterium]